MSFARLAAIFGAVGFACAALAQVPAAGSRAPAALDEPRFEIRRFIVENATLISREEIDAAVRPFQGPRKDFADVQRALEALERTYAAKGFNAVQVILPEQEIEKGEVRFRIIEAKIGAVVVEGNRFFDGDNVRASLPSLARGRAPNIHRIADNLRLANENPAKQTTVLLRGGKEEGQLDAVVRISDERPKRYSLTFDNTGTNHTGMYRVGVGFQHANLWNRDHVLSMQYVSAPNNAGSPSHLSLVPSRNVTIVGGSYRIPVYRFGHSVEITAGYSNVNSGIVQNLFNVSGAGTIFGLRYNLPMPRWGEVEQRIAFAWDWRAYRNKVSAAGSPAALVPDITVHPLSFTYVGAYRQSSHETTFNLSYHQNLPGGNDGDSSTFQASRLGARPGYTLWRFGINHNRAFANDWQMRVGLQGQSTRDRLVAGEQFGVGGIDSVRGFLEREVVNDYGFRGGAEFYSPDVAKSFEWLAGYRARGVLFYEFGRVQRNEPLISEPFRQGIGALGFGVRVARGVNLSLRLDYAFVVDKGGLQNRGDSRVHMTFAYIF